MYLICLEYVDMFFDVKGHWPITNCDNIHQCVNVINIKIPEIPEHETSPIFKIYELVNSEYVLTYWIDYNKSKQEWYFYDTNSNTYIPLSEYKTYVE